MSKTAKQSFFPEIVKWVAGILSVVISAFLINHYVTLPSATKGVDPKPKEVIDEYKVYFQGQGKSEFKARFTLFCVPQSSQTLSFDTTYNGSPEEGQLNARFDLTRGASGFTFKFGHLTGASADVFSEGYFNLTSDGHLIGRFGKFSEYNLLGEKVSQASPSCQAYAK